MFKTPDQLTCDPAEQRKSQHERFGDSPVQGMIRPMVYGGGQKIFLPRRSGEGRLAPRQYYYAASRSGVVPGSSVRAHGDVATLS